MNSEKRRKRKPKAIISESALETFERVKARLIEREMSEFNSSDLIDSMIGYVGEQFFDDFVEEKTPLEYKIKIALQDEGKRAEIEKIFSKSQKPRRTNSEKGLGA